MDVPFMLKEFIEFHEAFATAVVLMGHPRAARALVNRAIARLKLRPCGNSKLLTHVP